MKFKIAAIVALLIACPFQSYGMLKFVQDKYAKLQGASLASLYGVVGWSTYNFIKDQSSLTKRKLYAQDFPALGLDYLKHSEFDMTDKDITCQEAAQSAFYLEKSSSFDQLIKSHARSLSYGHIAQLYVSYINKNVGYGVFADRELEAGELIGEYTGKIYNRHDIKDKKSAAYGWALPNMLIVDASQSGNELRFVNHSYTPNVKIKYIPVEDRWRLVYIAKKPIAQDEQLVVNYGSRYWTAHGQLDEKTMEEFRFKKAKDPMQKWLEQFA